MVRQIDLFPLFSFLAVSVGLKMLFPGVACLDGAESYASAR